LSTRRKVRVDFREMPDYTKPKRYLERKSIRETEGYSMDYDYDEIADEDWPGNPADYGDR
jgi:hypothetical protein